MKRNTGSRVGWLEVDLSGLEKILARRGKEFLVFELIQNAWDAGCTTVTVNLPAPQRGKSQLEVTDDAPEGFLDLSHAFTLFAESVKKTNPEQRGVFNAGEKFVLALCEKAIIVSTRGGLIFDSSGRRRITRRTSAGSQFTGELRLTKDEWEYICQAVHTLLPPVRTIFNGQEIPKRHPLYSFSATLPTIVAAEDGRLKRKSRSTTINVYETHGGETASLYEMGLPVVSTGDKWHVEVQQKVPINLERDNVSPAYLQAVRVAVVNAMAAHLNEADASSTWVREAAGDPRIAQSAFDKTMDLRFGPTRVTYDPSDPEANLIAVSKGLTVIRSGSLSSDEWQNVRRFGSSLPAGRLTPSPKPFAAGGRPLRLLMSKDERHRHRRFALLAQKLGEHLLSKQIQVMFASDEYWPFQGCYGNATLTVNITAFGDEWFNGTTPVLLERWIPFLIHEFAHDRVEGHLTEAYHEECCRLAGLLARMIYEHREVFTGVSDMPGCFSES